MTPPLPLTLEENIFAYLKIVRQARSERTAIAYATAMDRFREAFQRRHKTTPTLLADLDVDFIADFIIDCKGFAPATESLYLTVARGFFEYLVAQGLERINLVRLRSLIRQRARKPGQRLPQFPKGAIEDLVDYVLMLGDGDPDAAQQPTIQRLVELRDRALIVTLVDTGLRISEACNLTRGDIDWHEKKARVIGKGDQEAIVRISERAIAAIQKYLAECDRLPRVNRRQVASLPIFTGHGNRNRAKYPITTKTGWAIVANRVNEYFGSKGKGTIHPHSFRHFFVTRVLSKTKNLKTAQVLARHKNIAVTQRYAHLTDDELDRDYNLAIEQPDGKQDNSPNPG